MKDKTKSKFYASMSTDTLPKECFLLSSKERIENARIAKVSLSLEEHNIFLAKILCEFDGGVQWFMFRPTDVKFIRLFDAMGVSSWEECVGLPVRIRHSHEQIYAIGHFTKDKWFFEM